MRIPEAAEAGRVPAGDAALSADHVDHLVEPEGVHGRGQREVVLFDNTRVDILTDSHAIEVDFAKKWAEAIGQALYYAAATGRKPGIVLIIKNRDRDRRYVYRCLVVSGKHGIRLWIMQGDEIRWLLPGEKQTNEGKPKAK